MANENKKTTEKKKAKAASESKPKALKEEKGVKEHQAAPKVLEKQAAVVSKAADKKQTAAHKADDKKPTTALKAAEKKPAAPSKVEEKKQVAASKAEEKKPAAAEAKEKEKPSAAEAPKEAAAEEKKPAKKKKVKEKKPKPIEKIQHVAGASTVSGKKKPRFMRQELPKVKKLDDRWRRPRGIDSKKLEGKRGKGALPSIGYGSPKNILGLHPSGLKPLRVSNVQELSKATPGIHGAIIAAQVGRRKRNLIIREANQRKIVVLNPRKGEV